MKEMKNRLPYKVRITLDDGSVIVVQSEYLLKDARKRFKWEVANHDDGRLVDIVSPEDRIIESSRKGLKNEPNGT